MRLGIFFLVFFAFSLSTTTPAQAQASAIGKGLAKILKWGGKTAGAAAIGAGVNYGFKKLFKEDNNRYITVNITNNYSSNTNIWITTDGINWTKYNLQPNYYASANSNRSGYVGVYDGYQYYAVNLGGNYRVSDF